MYRPKWFACALVLALTSAHLLTSCDRAQDRPRANLAGGPSVYIDTAHSPARGATTAPVTIVEFADYHCPACGKFARETFPRLDAEYIATGRVRYVFRDFPILSLHPQAAAAAFGARCAGEQGRYWEMHRLLFASQGSVSRDSLSAHARILGLDSTAFHSCVQSKRHGPAVRRALDDGRQLGVRGTPTYFLTVGEPGGKRVQVVRSIYGAAPYERFKSLLDSVLPNSAMDPQPGTRRE